MNDFTKLLGAFVMAVVFIGVAVFALLWLVALLKAKGLW